MHPDIRAGLAGDRQTELLRHRPQHRVPVADAPVALGRLAALYQALRHRRREIETREHRASTSATR